jgi:lipopolysaccharide/colanic/teichoic acid biosynthesis glycosyltransferase
LSPIDSLARRHLKFARRNAFPAWKRALDLALIFLALPLALPLAAAIGTWVKALGGRGRIFFCQERIGHGGRGFTIYKFRSMKAHAPTQGHENHVRHLMTSDRPLTKLDRLGDDRLIPGASVLRNLGLDELPQLLNVLRGEMSLVGPRPCLPEEFELYSEAQRERFSALPGLTGYWQVNGKNGTTFAEMVALDTHYARNKSLGMDLWIVVRTPLVIARQIFNRSGAPGSPRT